MGPDDGDPSALPPEEARLVAQAVDRRRRQFAAGRQLARCALQQLGQPVDALGVRDQRQGPAWPEGLVGSITHTDGLAVAIAAQRASLAGVGVDAEQHTPLSDAVADHVLLPAEAARWPGGQPEAMAVFAAKEAIYKSFAPCPAPQARALAFRDVEIVPAPTGFAALPQSARAKGLPAWPALRGHWWVFGDHVLALALRPAA